MLTMVWETQDERFSVWQGSQWLGWVWSDRHWWVAQDFDGDTEPGFSNFLSASQFVRDMARGSGFVS